MVTLVITDSHISIMAFQGKQVSVAASLPLDPGLVVDGVVVDSGIIGQRVKELLAAYDIAEKQFVVGISGLHSIYRVLTLPRLPKRMMDEAIRRQSEKILPISAREAYISWQAIDSSSTEVLVSLLALPRANIDSVVEALRLAEVEISVMDVVPMALARVVDESSAIIINAQAAGFDIVVMLDGIPRLFRSMTASTRDASIPDIADMLIEEFARTLSFIDSSHEGYPKKGELPIFVTGEAGRMMANSLSDYQVRPLPQWFYLPEGIDINDYAVNIGLALKKIRIGGLPSKVNMNVVPEMYKPKPLPVVEILSWVTVLVAMIMLVMVGISTTKAIAETASLQAELERLGQGVDIATGAAASLVKLRAELDEGNAELAIFEQPMDKSKEQRADVNDRLAKVTSLKPGNVQLTSINYRGNISVSGNAPDMTLVLNYVGALRDSGKFSKVVIQNLAEVKFNEWRFTLQLN